MKFFSHITLFSFAILASCYSYQNHASSLTTKYSEEERNCYQFFEDSKANPRLFHSASFACQKHILNRLEETIQNHLNNNIYFAYLRAHATDYDYECPPLKEAYLNAQKRTKIDLDNAYKFVEEFIPDLQKHPQYLLKKKFNLDQLDKAIKSTELYKCED